MLSNVRERGRTTGALNRRVGLEQEFFLVEESGMPSDRADEFLLCCREVTGREGSSPACFAPEFVMSLVEINTPPVYTLAELEREYLNNLRLALRTARSLGIRLYPLGTHPLPLEPAMRAELDYLVQDRTVGPERFVHAGRCAGMHLHLELAEGTVDPSAGIAASAPEGARVEALNLYNLATALDPALISLTRSCPFYEGINDGMAARTALYRGDPELAPRGLYALLQSVGGLLPYAGSAEELVEQQFARYYAWLETLDQAGIERRLFFELGGGLLQASSWNPVRLNAHGTVELRGIDSNYPETVLAISSLVGAAADRVRRESLSVRPRENLRVFEVARGTLSVPSFGYLDGELFRAAVTGGTESPAVNSYLDSVLRFSGAGSGFGAFWLGERYRTTEARILRDLASPVSWISVEKGLELVCEACDELEKQVTSLQREAAEAAKAGANGD